MFISKKAVKSFVSAALAVVVSGLVVGVSAQIGTPATIPDASKATFEVSYRVEMKNELIPTKKSLSGETLLKADPSMEINWGNLGQLQVKTNWALWDVTVSAANNGKLLADATYKDQCSPFGGCVQVVDIPGSPLKLSSGDAELQLFIGLVNETNTDFVGSKPYSFTTAIQGATPTSFASIIGPGVAASAAAETYNTQTGTQFTTGWITPKDYDIGATFYISAGLTAPHATSPGVVAGTPPSLGSNSDGDFIEILTFTFVGGY